MPSPYRHDYARLKAQVVARVEAGDSLRAIGEVAGLPMRVTVRRWAREDALFAAALAAARLRGAWRRTRAFDEGKAAELLARARAGEPIRSMIEGPDAVVSRRTYVYWKATQGPFAEAIFALRRRRGEALRARASAGRRAFDPATADRIIVRLNRGGPGAASLSALLKADPELPGRAVVRRWRREQPEFDRVLRTIAAARRRRGAPASEALIEAVEEHIVCGGSLNSFSRLPGTPSFNTLRRRMRDPAFAEAVRQACIDREDWYRDQIIDAPPGSRAQMQRALGPLNAQLARLRHRPEKPLWPGKR